MSETIDLRSDTVTRPTPAMRVAISEAEVGDAVIDIDPTVERLEQITAELLGKEAAVFMPSGSMTNQVAIRVHCDRGSEFICEADAHIYHYEQGAFAQLSGLVARTVAGDEGLLRLEQLAGLIRPDNDHMVRTRLVCLENTHNRWGGRIQDQQEVERVCQWAAENGLRRHLDGARLWNAAVATGRSERELCQPFDSVSVCFSKGLGRFRLSRPRRFRRRGPADTQVVRRGDASGGHPGRRRDPRDRTSPAKVGRRSPGGPTTGRRLPGLRTTVDSGRSDRHQYRHLRNRPLLGNGRTVCGDVGKPPRVVFRHQCSRRSFRYPSRYHWATA